jgi:hypothetical protein
MVLFCSRFKSGHDAFKVIDRCTMLAMVWLLLVFGVALASVDDSGRFLNCTSGLRRFDPVIHKKTYYVGVHAPGGVNVAMREYNLTFQDYLTATAGQRFNEPIEFKMKPTISPIYSWVDAKDEEVDFFYSDTGVYSCIGVERGAQVVATTMSEFTVRNHGFQLDVFAGKQRDKISHSYHREGATYLF